MEQQGGSGWYGGSQQQQYGGHGPLHPHPSMQWQVPLDTQHFNRSQGMHPSQQQQHYQFQQGQQGFQAQGGYYGAPAGYYAPHQQQVPQAPAPQPAVPQQAQQQHGMVYGQAEQGWLSSNGWNQQQWSSAGVTQPENSTAGLSQEEEWAAKARAWAASKTAQESQQHTQPHVQTQSDQSFPDNLQQLLPPPPPPPPPPPQPVDLSQQFAYQAPGQEPVTSAYGHDASSVFSHDISHKYVQDSPGQFGRDTSSRSQGEEMKPTSGSGPASTPAPPPPPPPTPRNISELSASNYSKELSSSHIQNPPPADLNVIVPPGMEQLQMPQLPVPPPPPPPASASLPHMAHQQPPQLASQLSPHPQTAHLQPLMPPSQFSFGEPPPPAPYDFHQQAPYEFQQPQPQEYQHPQPSQFNMAPDVPEAGAYGGLSHPQTWPPHMPYPSNNVGPGIGAGPGMGHQFEYEFEHMHPGHQHPQHLQGHNMFPRPPHGPGFRPGGPPLGHFGFAGNAALGPGAGAGMDFSMFIDNGHGHNVGPERPKKAPVPNWLKEELLKKKAAGAGGTQLTVTEDNPRANGDNVEASTHSKFELSDRSKSDLSRMSDSDEEDEEDDTEAARTVAMIQEIKRVLTEVLLKVTDDLFDEIAQEVMDEDEQRLLEDPTKKALLAEELGGAKAKPSAPLLVPAPAQVSAPVRVLVAPAVKRGQVDSDDDSESLSSGAPAGNLLGLASYASDDEEGGRNSGQVTEVEHVNGGNSDTEASELKSLAALKGEKRKQVDSEDEVVAAKGVKGKKRLSEEALNSDNSGRSPRRARHTEVSGDEVGQKELVASLKSGVPVNQVIVGPAASQKPDSGVAVEGRGLETVFVKEVAGEDKLNHRTLSHNAFSTERRKLGDAHDHLSKRRNADDLSQLRRADKEAVSSGRREHGIETDVKKAVKVKGHSNVKQGTKEADGDSDHKNGTKREKDLSRDEKDRVRENKERGRDKESLRSKERDHNVQKIKERERESDLEKQKAREKDKNRGKSTKARGRDSERERRKSTSEKYDRKSIEYKKEKEKGSKKVHRKRSSSLSSRSRSRSRSESSSASGSRSSSFSSPIRSGTPKRGKQQRGRSSKKSSHASPPSRSRRRTSRSPSRSVPHSKVSHRRHSPSLSREKERNRKSRSPSPAPKRRRS